jgi:hypothetical protein
MTVGEPLGEPSLKLRLAILEDGSSSWTFETAAFEVVAIGTGCVPLLHNSVLVAPDVLTPAECDELMLAADLWLAGGEEGDCCLRGGDEHEPLRRVRVSRMDARPRATVERMLKHRVFALMERHLPATTRALFGDAALSETAIRFAAAEPVVSVYTAGGALYPHEDLEALTVLIPLSPPDAFTGGGTSFWPDGCARHPNEHPECGTPMSAPSCVLKPLRGSAMLYGGGLLHAANEVLSGVRHIFVCSFSPSAPCSGVAEGGHAPHEAYWSEARRRGRGALNQAAVWTDLQGAFG